MKHPPIIFSDFTLLVIAGCDLLVAVLIAAVLL